MSYDVKTDINGRERERKRIILLQIDVFVAVILYLVQIEAGARTFSGSFISRFVKLVSFIYHT